MPLAAKFRSGLRLVEDAVSQDHFVSELRKGYEALRPADRKKKIRELVSESQETANFIRKEFPDFFMEAFPPASSNGGGQPSVSGSRPALDAKPR
jgi:hypothetical protein